MAQQSSRLNRLLTLLDTGSTQATRFTAARQIGDIAKSHPQDLTSLLNKVYSYLHSRNWDTRVAAAHAIGAIAQSIKHTSLIELFTSVEAKLAEEGISSNVDDIVALPHLNSKIGSSVSFRSFDLNKVLEFGALLASGGQEYDIMSDSSKSPRERLARQKQNLRRRLGLDMCEQFMDVNEMIKDEDLIVHKSNLQGNGISYKMYPNSAHNIQRFVSNMVPTVSYKRPSARELNLLKRKAKIGPKDQVKGSSEDSRVEIVSGHGSTSSKGILPNSISPCKVEPSDEGANSENDGEGRWPFHGFVEKLILDMFDPGWEIRHGSAMAMREILTHHGASAGVIAVDMIEDGSLWHEIIERENKSRDATGSTIDLNMQFSSNEFEPNPKRPKIEEESKFSADISDMEHNNESVTTSGMTAESGCGMLVGQANGFEGDIEVKLEHESVTVGMACQLEEAKERLSEKPIDEGKVILADHNVEKKVNENHQLMKLVKVARHSWLKNSAFLQDCVIRFLCVLSLDRFGDYVSDQVVAPVRETCAQALGAAFKYMHPSLVHETLNILLQMQCRPEWEIRHGSLLGIKYLVAVRQEMLHGLLERVLPACKTGLEDSDDDVRAVAADALIPAATSIVALKNQTLYSIVMLLWDILLDLDDLSPSTSSVMNLLAEIYSQEDMVLGAPISEERQNFDLNDLIQSDDNGDGKDLLESAHMLSILAPRLWPFMRHSISSVRHSAIRTLERLLEASRKKNLPRVCGGLFWPSPIMGDTLRIVFQNLLLESKEGILQCSERVWRLLVQCSADDLEIAARTYMSSWIELATTPYGSSLETSKMFWPVAPPRKSHFRAAAKMKAVRLENESSGACSVSSTKAVAPQERNDDRSMNSIKIVVGAEMEMSVTNTRVVTASALGIFASRLNEGSLHFVLEPLWNALKSLSGVQRQVASMVLISWFQEIKFTVSISDRVMPVPCELREWLLDLLTCTDPAFPTKGSRLPYTELSRTYVKMRNESRQLLHSVERSSLLARLIPTSMEVDCLSADDAIDFASNLKLSINDGACSKTLDREYLDDVESSRQRLLTTAGYLKCVQGNLHITVTSLIAAAIVWMSEFPPRLNPIILPLMASIKREQEEILQQKAAVALSELIAHCISRKPSPNDKLIKNICSLTWTDPCETPQASTVCSFEMIDDQDFLSFGSNNGKQKSKVQMIAGGEERSKVEGFKSRRGSELALRHLCQKFGASLFEKLPKLWDCLSEILVACIPTDQKKIETAIESVKDPQILINNVQLIRSIAPSLNESLKPKLLEFLPCIFLLVRHSHVAVRLAASRCILSMARSMTVDVMAAVVDNAIPMLGDTSSVHARQGAGMLISLLVQGLGVELVPYAPLLVVPLLRCMSDIDNSVRQSVTRSFAALVPLLPLARGVSPPPGVGEGLSGNAEDTKFLEQLLDNSHIDDYKLSTELKVSLRRYQQEGINWLAFLKRFKLHGILCDDMGLGKTLQASAIIASDIAERQTSSDGKDGYSSLIVCPSTLVGHWAFEIEKYIDVSLISPLQYVGSALDRASLRDQFDKHNVIITSYDVVRKDADYLGQFLWNYCILDEGHIIKNAKSKITLAVKQLKAQHRLILSGTPIQNNIMDLWSLFDFLMPGFLGSERQFQATYGKPLLAARDPKRSSKDAEAGILAMEALHKQVMPFLLRRTKDEVLSDLPEKIIQDRYCDLSKIQLKLYEQFSGSKAKQEISSIVDESESGNGNSAPSKASSHVFQAIQYLLKLCSHPLLVLGEKLPQSVVSQLSEYLPPNADVVSELHKPQQSPKLVALQEILEECGVGADSSDNSVCIGQHRVLIFAQHKAFLDIIERDLLQTHMKSVTYLRLDGSVETDKRFDIVKAFNSDPTIDALLLTTHVGGLGLNLTSADTLVFMEHDWNPMRDLQAMDRAHRLGQRKVVNVHRLIMRGTLEEKVMSLQRFKVSVANAVINAENASLKTMNTDQLLDLFASADTSKKTAISSKRPDGEDPKLMGTGKGVKAILGGLEELWDQSQYTEEYNLNQFLAKLNG